MSARASTTRISRLLLGVAAVLTILVVATPARAQRDSPAPAGGLLVVDAHIEGTGPWTSIFGAAPDRELVIEIANTSDVPIEDPELILTFGKGANPTGSVTPPPITRIEPGESVVVRAALDLPSFAYGTYAVEGTFPGFDPPVRFRAETSHIPWLLFVAPLLILFQLGLVTLRNLVRRRIFAPSGELAPTTNDAPADIPDIVRTVIDLRDDRPTGDEFDLVDDLPEPEPEPAIDLTPEPEPVTDPDPVTDHTPEPEPEPAIDLTPEPELDTIIGEELGVAFGRVFIDHAKAGDRDEFRALVISLTNAAAERVAERAQLSASERKVLGTEMAQAVLETFESSDAST